MVTDPFAGHRQQVLQQRLYRDWSSSPSPAPAGGAHARGAHARGAHAGGAAGTAFAVAKRPPSADRIKLVKGQPFALIRVPAFGRSWKFAIVQGTDAAQLALGPGHVPGTGLPGRPGNFVVAAHDVTAGNPFLHLKSLRHPDKVYVYTRNWVYKYVIETEHVVKYTDVGVEYAVPNHPGQAPRTAMITLITCTPDTLTFTPWRVVVTGQLVGASPRQ
jgi:sortase A